MMNSLDDYLAKAKKGDVISQRYVGTYLCINSKEYSSEGVEWLKKAANQNDAKSMYLLGCFFANKYNNLNEGFNWLLKSAELGDADAMVDVSAFYLLGAGIEKDIDKSIEWNKRASELGSVVAIYNLGYINLMHKEDEASHKLAFEYLNDAKDKGYINALYILGVAYLYGIGIEKSPKQAVDYFSEMYEKRPGISQIIGNLYFQGEIDGTPNYSKAQEWYLKGVNKKVVVCMEILGYWYLEGLSGNVDYDLAFDFFEMAYKNGSADAAFEISNMYFEGKGFPKNNITARNWMIKSAELGNENASKFIQKLNQIINNGAAVAQNAINTSSGIKIHSSYSADAESINSEYESRYREKRERKKSIYASAGAMSGNGSFTDYDMGAVVGSNGEVSYVDPELGIILGSDGSISSHNAETGFTYNWSNGRLLSYDDKFDATVDLKDGSVAFNFNGFTIK